jgi:hypothetical protein
LELIYLQRGRNSGITSNMDERADPLVWVRTAGNWEPEAGPKKASLTQSDARIGVSQLRVEREDQSTKSLAGWAVENSGKLMAREMRPTTAGQIGHGGESVMGAAGVSLDRKPWPDL